VTTRETHVVREDSSGAAVLLSIVVGALLVAGLLYFGFINWPTSSTTVISPPADTVVVPAPSVEITPQAVEPPAPAPEPAPAPAPAQ
jgi:hypothetical protein